MTVTTPAPQRPQRPDEPVAPEPGIDDDPAGTTTGSDAATKGSRVAAFARSAIPPLLVLVVVVVIWYALSYLLLEPRRRFLLPPPHAVLQTGFFDADNLGDIMSALWASTKVALTGLVIAIIVGTAFAVAMSQARWVERSFYPWAVVLQTIPILALVPLSVSGSSTGSRSRVLVCVLIALFPIVDEHAVRPQVGRSRATTICSRCTARDRWQRLVQAAVPGRAAGDLHGLADLGRAVGDRCHRRRLLLPSGRAGHRPADRRLHARGCSPRQLFAADHLLVAARPRRVLGVRAALTPRRRVVARARRGPTCPSDRGHPLTDSPTRTTSHIRSTHHDPPTRFEPRRVRHAPRTAVPTPARVQRRVRARRGRLR